jgi:hypothetical protein
MASCATYTVSPMAATGLCECGCGQSTKPAITNLKDRGLSKGQPQRFIAGHYRKTAIREEDRGYRTPCHIGPWKPESNGYCRVAINKQRIGAHRYYYEQAKGPIPAGFHVDHLCRQRACVNPDHLEAVPPVENRRRQPNIKLSVADVEAIRTASTPNAALALAYGVDPSYVSQIRSGVRRRR